MASRLKLARAGAAVAGASVALMMTAVIPAGADPATGKVSGDNEDGYHVNVGRGHYADLSTSLMGFELTDGTKLQMYCVEIDTDLSRQEMVEKHWDSYPNADSPFNDNRDRINWILHNGYPVVDTDGLTSLLADAAGYDAHNGIDRAEAVTATQAAIWHFSDDKNLNLDNPFPQAKGHEDAKADVVALYKYLTGDANVGIGDQPTPALEISPTDLTGKTGERIGPFTVTTTGDVDKLTSKLPDGVKITDANGAELTAEQIENGTQLFLDVPAGTEEGAGIFELTATAGIDTGRLFVGKDYAHNATQSLIVAKAEKSEIVAKAGGAWAETAPPSTTTPPTTETTAPPTTTTSQAAPAPQPKNTSGGLAETGASIFAPVVIGIVLLAAGVGSLLFLRHRRRV